jgi:hypothetical protein
MRSLLSHGIPKPLRLLSQETGSDLKAAEAVQVTWWPERSLVVRYRARFEGGLIPGERQIVATTGEFPTGAMVVEGSGGTQVGLWLVPFDPALPGLASALDPATSGALLEDLGLRAGKVRTRLRAYRPGKRAVVEVSGPANRIYLKLVPPTEVERLHRIHRLLVNHVPVPHSLGYAPDLGLIALEALAGTTLRNRLEGRGPIPAPAALDDLLAALPEPDRAWTAGSPLGRIPRLSDLLSRLVPEHGDQIRRLEADIGEEDAPADQPVHGDFYEAQVMVAHDRITGLLDFDTFGWGRATDDAATLIGHLAILADRQPGSRFRAFGKELLERADARFDPADMRRRVAAVIASLATGPFRVQRPDWPTLTAARLALAARWVESARRVEGQATIAS